MMLLGSLMEEESNRAVVPELVDFQLLARFANVNASLESDEHTCVKELRKTLEDSEFNKVVETSHDLDEFYEHARRTCSLHGDMQPPAPPPSPVETQAFTEEERAAMIGLIVSNGGTMIIGEDGRLLPLDEKEKGGDSSADDEDEEDEEEEESDEEEENESDDEDVDDKYRTPNKGTKRRIHVPWRRLSLQKRTKARRCLCSKYASRSCHFIMCRSCCHTNLCLTALPEYMRDVELADLTAEDIERSNVSYDCAFHLAKY
jgi:hypothetical protein